MAEWKGEGNSRSGGAWERSEQGVGFNLSHVFLYSSYLAESI
jgi:hypothetical protein